MYNTHTHSLTHIHMHDTRAPRKRDSVMMTITKEIESVLYWNTYSYSCTHTKQQTNTHTYARTRALAHMRTFLFWQKICTAKDMHAHVWHIVTHACTRTHYPNSKTKPDAKVKYENWLIFFGRFRLYCHISYACIICSHRKLYTHEYRAQHRVCQLVKLFTLMDVMYDACFVNAQCETN